jgi:hypothetical protein
MPIREFFKDSQAFGPDDIELLTAVFEDVLSTLNLSNRRDPATLVIAQRIIALAKEGERDPVRLREDALKSLAQ